MILDLIIIGGGPAGAAAAVYAARKQLKTALIAKEFGGQSNVSEDIQNWIGTISITGAELAENLKKHVAAYAGGFVEIKEGQSVKKIEGEFGNFSVATDKEILKSKMVLIATGSRRRKLLIPGAKEYENKGITYCASCDGLLFSGKDVAVVGGGNAAFETAAQLSAYCKSVTIIQRGAEFRADPVTVKKVLGKPNVKAETGTDLLEIKGKQFVTDIVFKKAATGETIDLPVEGIFVEIGLIPATDFVQTLVKLNKWGHIVTDPRTGQTSVKGIWAAGDATDGLYHQNNIAAGDAVKALEDIYLHLHAK